ncbi:MAG: hypothetical protein II453_16560 [Alphaproteobacteria bacterium]|nr:hypothetical protein [Alphaproteobacteria bacterium]
MEKISAYWYPSKIVPLFAHAIVYVSANGKVGTFKELSGDWKRYVEKWNIKYWVYASDLTSELPLWQK